MKTTTETRIFVKPNGMVDHILVKTTTDDGFGRGYDDDDFDDDDFDDDDDDEPKDNPNGGNAKTVNRPEYPPGVPRMTLAGKKVHEN